MPDAAREFDRGTAGASAMSCGMNDCTNNGGKLLAIVLANGLGGLYLALSTEPQ